MTKSKTKIVDVALYKIIYDVVHNVAEYSEVTILAEKLARKIREPILKSEALLLVTEMWVTLRERQLARNLLAEALTVTRHRDGSAMGFVLDTAKRLGITGFQKYRCEAAALEKRQKEYRRTHRRGYVSIRRPQHRQWRYQILDRVEKYLKNHEWAKVRKELEIEAKIKDPYISFDSEILVRAIYHNPRAQEMLLPVLQQGKKSDYILADLSEIAVADLNVDKALWYLSQVKSRNYQIWFAVGLLFDYVHNECGTGATMNHKIRTKDGPDSDSIKRSHPLAYAFEQWVTKNVALFRGHEPVVLKREKQFTTFRFRSIAKEIKLVIGEQGQFFIKVDYCGRCFDLIAEWDVLLFKTNRGYHCDLCLKKIFYPSQADLLIGHSVRPMLKWAVKNFKPENRLILGKIGLSSTFAKIANVAPKNRDHTKIVPSFIEDGK